MKKRYKTLTALLVSSQLLGAVSPVMAGESRDVHRYIPEEAYTDTYQEDYSRYLNNRIYSDSLKEALEDLKERSESISSNEKLNVLINDFASLHEAMNREDAGHFHADSQLLGYDVSLEVFENIRDAIYKEGNATRLIRFANQLGLGVSQGASGFQVLIQNLVETNSIKSAQAALEEVDGIILNYQMLSGAGQPPRLQIIAGKLVLPVNEEKVLEELKKDPLTDPTGGGIDIEHPGALEEPDSVLDSAKIVDYDKDYVPSELNDSLGSMPERKGTYYEYDSNKNQRIRVDYVIKVVDGEEKRTETRTVEAEGLVSMWSDRFAEHFSGSINTSRPDWANETKEEAEEASTLTLQYTLNKDDAFPVYVDTGLFTETDGSASYEDVYEVLYQIAVNTENGYLVEDADKLLTIVENRPVYILEEDETYSQEDIENLFASFANVELIVAETRIGTTDSLEWQLRTGQEQRVVIDEEEVSITTPPNVRGERVVLPIVEMMEAIGAFVEMDDTTITARYDSYVIAFEDGVADARIDEELVSLSVPVERNEQGVYTTNLMPVFEAVGIESLWDEQESALILDGTQRQEMLEAEREAEESESEETPDEDELDEDAPENENEDEAEADSED